MLDRRLGTLALALGATLATAPVHAGAVLDYVGTHVWSEPQASFGGFSAIQISPDGTGFHALTDRAHLYWGRVERDPQGLVRGMAVAGRAHLKDSEGTPLPPGYIGDSEGIALDAEGRILISFEGLDRVARYDDPDAAATPLPRPPKLPGMGVNSGLEALAIDQDGLMVAVPERSGNEATPFTVLAFDGDWTEYATIRRDPRWLAVGADFGPDGWLYLLERDFRGILGFSSRIRRMQLTPGVLQEDQILLETRSLQYDNLEGISVWHDGTGIRITMISDDNFLFLQRTEIVEYRLRDTDLQAQRN
ncbi:esterase-like activity of phytase family protein [Paracoccus gahaiensis]|uniref:Esterase-like activity of phytase family protein n=1 Tax=Paracoccus gahaiensis TaxID=1706839 RepID=A0A4U0RCT2_9RHOB|nr:esterase-like activity of phytase family protein [Paracoccus gahaiensis]TJZ92330.1 esterase-like activity of phytase family protein [Paracoccus gahaiensis]